MWISTLRDIETLSVCRIERTLERTSQGQVQVNRSRDTDFFVWSRLRVLHKIFLLSHNPKESPTSLLHARQVALHIITWQALDNTESKPWIGTVIAGTPGHFICSPAC